MLLFVTFSEESKDGAATVLVSSILSQTNPKTVEVEVPVEELTFSSPNLHLLCKLTPGESRLVSHCRSSNFASARILTDWDLNCSYSSMLLTEVVQLSTYKDFHNFSAHSLSPSSTC